MQPAALEEQAATGPLPDPTTRIVAAARTWAHALDTPPRGGDEVLVIGSSTASLVSWRFLGSNGAKILRHSPVPAIVVP